MTEANLRIISKSEYSEHKNILIWKDGTVYALNHGGHCAAIDQMRIKLYGSPLYTVEERELFKEANRLIFTNSIIVHFSDPTYCIDYPDNVSQIAKDTYFDWALSQNNKSLFIENARLLYRKDGLSLGVSTYQGISYKK